jgi:hypothetical protein
MVTIHEETFKTMTTGKLELPRPHAALMHDGFLNVDVAAFSPMLIFYCL